MTGSQRVVLDASAFLALLFREPGHDRVTPHLGHAVLCSVNLAEVYQKHLDRGLPLDYVRAIVEAGGVSIVSFTAAHAELTASLRARTRSYGLSLADRACLSLGIQLAAPILTTDKAWQRIDLGAQVEVIR